ncbi:hypothetical protein IEQ34_007432 [Dendrobium chrysotoxum]|uniref:Uncharacterized protein n=1 Tax=Dendrobium chrysotoxum TaxID=161865 RepID=A0AAV7H7S9_DENCH|nr:hypothetical protein IEQ34_007432 [Dendrobium chrysotoxum]
MKVCDFNLCSIFIMKGWEGSVLDNYILKFSILYHEHQFHRPSPSMQWKVFIQFYFYGQQTLIWTDDVK